MSTVVNFGGKQVIEPGVYAQTKALVNSIPQDFSTGNVLIIDTGSGAGWGGGSGIDGELKKGLDSVYSFDNLPDFRNFVKGGLLWDLADYVFNPLNGATGATKLMIARAATTLSADAGYTFTGGVTVPPLAFVASNLGALTIDVTCITNTSVGMFAGVFGDIYISTDGGANWAIDGALSAGGFVTQIVEGAAGSIYAATSAGVYKSIDIGATWTLSNTGLTNTYCTGIAVDSSNNLFVGTTSGVFKSTNGAGLWNVTGNTDYCASVYVDSQDSVWVGLVYNAAGLKKSVNGGTTFTTASTGIANPGWKIFQTIFDDGTNLYVGTNVEGVFKSTDNGANWVQKNYGLTNYDVKAFCVNTDGYLFCSTGVGVFRTIDAGNTWSQQTSGLLASQYGAMIMVLDFVFAGTNTGGVYVTNAVTTGGAPLNGGTFVIKTKNEGVGANGVATGAHLDTGYSVIMKAGLIDNTKFILEFYLGTYHGVDPDGDDYGGVTDADSAPLMVTRSIEFDNIAGVIAWMETDFSFSQAFTLYSSAVNGTGQVTNSDLVANPNQVLFSGGATTYSAGNLDTLLATITELDNSFFLCDKWGDDAQGVENTKILAHVTLASEFKKFIYVGGGIDESKFTGTNSSIETAQYYNSAYVTTVHSGCKIKKLVGTGLKTLPSIYHAASVLGREAGVAPQTSLTFKAIRLNNFNHNLRKSEREQALQAGVLHNRFVPNIGYVVNQGINTLQKNTQMINPDGTSCEKSVMRIAEQLNKELVLNIRPIFIGGNLNTSSPADVKAFVEGYLTKKIATKIDDNLIIRFQKVAVKQVQDQYYVTYEFVPNSPVNKIFVTSFIVDANLSA